jgi:hypothetical protein
MDALILEISSASDLIRDDGADRRWLLGKPISFGLKYLDYLKIINRAHEEIIGFAGRVFEYPIWNQLIVHAHTQGKEVFIFISSQRDIEIAISARRKYWYLELYHSVAIESGCCWRRNNFVRCIPQHRVINFLGECQEHPGDFSKCYLKKYCEMWREK